MDNFKLISPCVNYIIKININIPATQTFDLEKKKIAFM